MEQTVKALRICIIGAGVGGLTSALSLAKADFEHIEVFESANDLGFVGAGIQLAPNMARVLDRMGVWSDAAKDGVVLNETSIRQGATDEELTHVDLTYIADAYDYPHMVEHRSSLAQAIYSGCLREAPKITFHFSTTVTSIQSLSSRPTFTATTANGDSYIVTADVLLGADGIKSATRAALLSSLQTNDTIHDTGTAAYRILLPRSALAQDPDLLALLDQDRATRWIAPKRHIIAYPVARHTLYNISTAQPDLHFASAPSAAYTTRGSKADMLAVFADFCPLVRRLLDLAPAGDVCEWKLRVHAPLPTWVAARTALVGDACHPTLPHLAQGAAQAVEDAAVLGEVLRRLPDADTASIEQALRVYERVRKGRAEALVEMAAASGRALHLGEEDEEARRERDAAFAKASKGGDAAVPDKWADKDVQRTIYGFDCVKAAGTAWDEWYGKL